MIRILGGLILAVSCAGLGMLESGRLKKRILHLKAMIRIASFLEREISYAKSPLPEALSAIGERMAAPFSGFLEGLSRELRRQPGEPFAGILNQEIQRHLKETELSREDLEEFYRAASDLGYLDKQMQVHILQTYRMDQETKVERLTGELPEKQKLFRSLGILGGVFLVLLLL